MKEVVHKPVILADIPAKIKKVQDRGLFVLANFIVGYPGETWDEIQDTIRFAEHCGADYIKLFVAVPLKNTKMWDQAVHLGVLDKDENDISVDWRLANLLHGVDFEKTSALSGRTNGIASISGRRNGASGLRRFGVSASRKWRGSANGPAMR